MGLFRGFWGPGERFLGLFGRFSAPGGVWGPEEDLGATPGVFGISGGNFGVPGGIFGAIPVIWGVPERIFRAIPADFGSRGGSRGVSGPFGGPRGNLGFLEGFPGSEEFWGGRPRPRFHGNRAPPLTWGRNRGNAWQGAGLRDDVMVGGVRGRVVNP